MLISDLNDYAIRLPIEFEKYNREKSSIIFEGGTEQNYNGRLVFVGSFIAKIWYKGVYRFDCEIETWGNGKKLYSVTHKKLNLA